MFGPTFVNNSEDEATSHPTCEETDVGFTELIISLPKFWLVMRSMAFTNF